MSVELSAVNKTNALRVLLAVEIERATSLQSKSALLIQRAASARHTFCEPPGWSAR